MWLATNTRKIYPTLKDACRRQLRNHVPGNIHLLLNTAAFALGTRGHIEDVKRVLIGESDRLFRDYSRVWRVYYDIVTPPRWGSFVPEAERFSLTNRRSKLHPIIEKEPLPVILW